MPRLVRALVLAWSQPPWEVIEIAAISQIRAAYFGPAERRFRALTRRGHLSGSLAP